MENFNICQHDEFCGGCIYQGVPYEEQLAVKEAEVKNIFAEKDILIFLMESRAVLRNIDTDTGIRWSIHLAIL